MARNEWIFSDKQLDFFQNSTAAINIADGAVRSGKTHIFNARWLKYLLTGPPGDLFMSGKSLGTIERNVLNAQGGLFDLLGKDNYVYRRGRNATITTMGRTIYIIGANDRSAEGRLRGATFAGGYCDEVTLYPEEFINQIVLRCSVTGAQMFWNCNPDNPHHHIKTNYIDNPKRQAKLKLFHFELDDNPILDEEYKERLRTEFTGMWFKRYVLGLWCMAEGSIYPMFDEGKHCIRQDQAPNKFSWQYVFCDYGITNPHVYLRCGVSYVVGVPHLWILNEYYNDGSDNRIKTDELLLRDYFKFIGKSLINDLIPDPSATSFINLAKQNNVSVRNANNDVRDGIMNVSRWLSEGRIHIVKENCPNLIKEFYSYSWDSKASERGEDVPLKTSDHCLDGLRYGINTLFPQKTGGKFYDVLIAG